MTEAAEFHQIYKLGVVPIPTNKPMIRDDQADLVYKTEDAKFDAVVDDIAERHEKGQPVLVGTVERREVRAAVGAAEEARRPARGAQRQAARAGGRDRRRGRAARAPSRSPPTWPAAAPTSCSAATSSSSPTTSCARRGPRPGRDRRRSTRRPGPRRVEQAKQAVEAEHDEVAELGGLYVLGTERHESRRIDNQLRGRSGRQGDPGESRFYLSLGDDLMRLFNAAHGRDVPHPVQHPRRRADRVEDGHQRDPVRADPGRGAELRDPQERPQVRRGAQPPAHRHLRRAPPGARGRGPARAGPAHDRRRRRGLRRRRDRRGLRRGVGPRPALDRAQAALPGVGHASTSCEEASGGDRPA